MQNGTLSKTAKVSSCRLVRKKLIRGLKFPQWIKVSWLQSNFKPNYNIEHLKLFYVLIVDDRLCPTCSISTQATRGHCPILWASLLSWKSFYDPAWSHDLTEIDIYVHHCSVGEKTTWSLHACLCPMKTGSEMFPLIEFYIHISLLKSPI